MGAMVTINSVTAERLSPEQFAQFLIGSMESDKSEAMSRSTQARDAMEAILDAQSGKGILQNLLSLAGPLLDSIFPGLGSILGGLKGGGGKGGGGK